MLLWHVPTPRRGRERRSADRPPIVVPARDEEANLGRLLPSLAGWDVVVVDDGSADATAAVARANGATVVDPGPPADGWTGKAWACAAGASAASASSPASERLVFLDADVVVEPGGLDRILAEHDDVGGLLSVQPWHAVERPYEHLSAFFNLIAPMSIDAFTPLGRRLRPTGAFGPCLVVDRETYEVAGGHGADDVRGAVLDDVALARALGPPTTVLGGRGSIRFRMYPHGLATLVEGWTKNFAGGAAGTRPVTLLLVLVWMSGLIGVVVERQPLLYGAYVVQLLVLLRRVGRFSPLVALLYPIPLAFFVGVFLRSLVLTFGRRRVRWRGRTLPT